MNFIDNKSEILHDCEDNFICLLMVSGHKRESFEEKRNILITFKNICSKYNNSMNNLIN